MAGQPLVIPVGATIKDLERAMRESVRLVDKSAREMEERFGRVDLAARFGAGALKGAIAALSFDKIIRGFSDANAELAKIGDTAKRIGLDTQRLQELQFAGRQNGLKNDQVGSGLESLTEKLNEIRQSENGLSKLLDDNNVKYKDRKGEVISTNDALGQVANLVRNAATEFDKIKIAEAAGLTRDWIPLLEQGADALNRQAAAAREAGAVIDSDVIQKAKDFERDWSNAVDRWSTMFRANLGGIIGLIDSVIGKAGELGGAITRYAERVSAVADLQQNGIEGASRDSIQWGLRQGDALGLSDADLAAARKRLGELNELDREARRGVPAAPLKVTVRPTSGQRTDTSSLFSKGGGGKGGGGGKSEEDQAQERLERYIETLMRQNAVLDAEIATFGKSNAEKRAAVELAKAGVDLAKLDEAERQKVIASLQREIDLSEEKRTTLERLKLAQQGVNDAAKYLGNSAVDALEDFIFNGAKAEDVARRLAASLAKAALQALLLGDGPLAGLFGTKAGSGGGLGGLLGGLIGSFGGARAGGGPVSPGRAYLVGEKRPELFVPGSAGRIVPRVPDAVMPARGGGSSSTQLALTVDVRGATGNEEIQRMVAAGMAQAVSVAKAQVGKDILGMVSRADHRMRI